MKKLLMLTICAALCLTSALQAVKITTSDDQEFEYINEVEIAALRQNKTVDNFLEDLGELEDVSVPLPEVSSAIWPKIMNCCQLLHVAHTLEGDDKKDAYNKLHDILAACDRNVLYAFISSLNYLNNEELLDRALERWLSSHTAHILKHHKNYYLLNTHINQLLQEKIQNQLTAWFAADGQKPVVCTKTLKHGYWIKDVCYSPDGDRIASLVNVTYNGILHNSLCIWDARTGALLHTIEDTTFSISSMCYSPDGHFLVVASKDGVIHILNATTYEELYILIGHTARINKVCYSPDGNYIASSSSADNTIRIWDAHTRALVRTLTDSHGRVGHTMCYSPNGRHIASSSSNYCSIYIWDVHTGAKVAILIGHTNKVHSICYSPDSNLIASVCYDGKTCIWDAHTGTLIHTLTNNTQKAQSICYSPGGTYITSGSRNSSVYIWNAHTIKLLHTLPIPKSDDGWSSWASSVCYSPNGDYLAIASDEGSIYIWDVMHSTKKFIRDATDEQRLLLYLAYQKKQRQATLALNKPHLIKPFAHLTYDQQRLMTTMLPLEIPPSQLLLFHVHEHKNKLMTAIGLSALGYLTYQYLKK